MKIISTLLGSVALLLFWASATPAQDFARAHARLLAAKSIRCQFETTSQGSFGELPKVSVSSQEPPCTYDSINLKKGTARIIGKGGAGNVSVVPSGVGVTFIERTPNGGFSFDTVYSSGEQAGKYWFVNSRHVEIFMPLPSQSYGRCWILE